EARPAPQRRQGRDNPQHRRLKMDFFTVIPDAHAIVYMRGVYRQAALYLRGDKVYAKWGGGFIRLSQGGATSHPNVRWADLDAGLGVLKEAAGSVAYLPPVGEVVSIAAAE